ncbi:hypothetical protein Cph01nite_10230 [Cellulomonas phragmiteti]|uniref:HTH arsR-type domain-containing protein n=1 Tax=Cellulomonas phragmiteti TaxID=478780 RepID=A0ABQ4DK11_9CELL|nr:hypothetical protein Cph01nite_10230 [Cellulomonas phragmiteti]
MPPDPATAGTRETTERSSSDPERIRALAHPLRLQLLDLLDAEGELTATQCARLTGESVAGCAFHLHTLARWGYVEPGARRGREKPWRSARRRDSRYDPDRPETLRAVTEVARLSLERETDRLHRWLDDAARLDPRWLQASSFQRSSLWATDDELRELAAELERIGERFAGRSDDPSTRPPAARHALLFAALTPDVDR